MKRHEKNAGTQVTPKICIVILEETFQEALDTIKNANAHALDLIEIRLDKLREPLNQQSGGGNTEILDYVANINRLIEVSKAPVILTVGGREKPHDYRARIETLADTKAEYIDVDIKEIERMETEDDYRGQELIKELRTKSKSIILSYHNFDDLPARGELEKELETLFQKATGLKMDILKVAYKVESDKEYENFVIEIKRVRGKFAESNMGLKVVPIAMGLFGKKGRTFNSELKPYISYTAIRNSEDIGQLTIKELTGQLTIKELTGQLTIKELTDQK